MFAHTPVLLNETIDALNIREDGIYFDGTLGGAGHAFEIAKRLRGSGHLFGTDQDAEALEAAKARLQPFADRVTLWKANYESAEALLKEAGVVKLDGILLDLGVSSHQLDTADRGFSYRENAPLDMRMDPQNDISAYTIVNEYGEKELTRILRDYGEERFAAAIAKQIVKRRETEPVETTFELNDIVRAAIPAKMRERGGHPSKRTFQALRIACNRELDVLEHTLDPMTDMLAKGGRFAVITFHSLEDRIVKQHFRTAENPCTCPPSFPVCVCGKKPKGHVVTRKALTASKEELEQNRRAKSAHLRVFEHI